MTSIAELKLLTNEQIEALTTEGIITVDDLWTRVGGDFTEVTSQDALWATIDNTLIPGLDEIIAVVPGLTREDLVRVLSAQSVAIAEAKHDAWHKRNWLKLLAWAMVIVIIVLGCRALGGFQALPEPLGLQDSVLVASHNLQSGSTLRHGDVHTALLVAEPDYFTYKDRLDGFILSKPIQSERPIRYGDVLRPQLTATKDVPAGALLASDAISVTWSTFQPDALTQPVEAVGHKLRHSLKAGEVVSRHLVEENLAWVSEVRLRTTPTVPAGSLFQLLGKGDLVITETTAIPPDLTGFITQVDLTGRQVVSLTVKANTSPLNLNQPLRVALLFYPQGIGDIVPSPMTLQDVILLSAAQPESGSPSILVAVKPDDLERALPLIGAADIFVLQPLP